MTYEPTDTALDELKLKYIIINENIMTYIIKKWVWEHGNYPDFLYDRERLLEKIKRVKYLRALVSSVLSVTSKDELETTNLTNK